MIPLDKYLYGPDYTNRGMREESEYSTAGYLKKHLEQIVVDTSATSSAPGRLKPSPDAEEPGSA